MSIQISGLLIDLYIGIDLIVMRCTKGIQKIDNNQSLAFNKLIKKAAVNEVIIYANPGDTVKTVVTNGRSKTRIIVKP
jgi:hypothetical protein